MTALQPIPFDIARVWLAPMSGATDAPFRRQAVRFGAPAVVSEMVAGEALLAARPDMVRRICRHEGRGLWLVQLAARRPQDMLAGARLLAAAGVDVIDINMGCPSRQVTGGQSGSALMRDEELAQRIIAAALEGAGGRPVTLKMRLGWDDTHLNAPEIGRMAEKMGCAMLTVHGRTRCQFYKGQADWTAIGKTVRAVTVPVIANGDIGSLPAARQALAASGAYGVMVGRACMGAPWLPGLIAGTLTEIPELDEQCDSLCEQISDSVSLYGEKLGVRIVRKHVAAAIDRLAVEMPPARRVHLRRKLCRISDMCELLPEIGRLYSGLRATQMA